MLIIPVFGEYKLGQFGPNLIRDPEILSGFQTSQMLSKNMAKFLGDIIKEGKIQFDMENEIVHGCLLTHEKKIVHEMTRKNIEGAK